MQEARIACKQSYAREVCQAPCSASVYPLVRCNPKRLWKLAKALKHCRNVPRVGEASRKVAGVQLELWSCVFEAGRSSLGRSDLPEPGDVSKLSPRGGGDGSVPGTRL